MLSPWALGANLSYRDDYDCSITMKCINNVCQNVGLSLGKPCVPGTTDINTNCMPGLRCFTNSGVSVCVVDCTAPDTLLGRNPWRDVAADSRYQSLHCAPCDSSNCTLATHYRCNTGNYGNPSTTMSGCTTCPKLGSITATSAPGTKNITDCYIPSGTTVQETPGTYTLTANCGY